MREIRTSGLMSGDGKRGDAAWPKPPRPSSTLHWQSLKGKTPLFSRAASKRSSLQSVRGSAPDGLGGGDPGRGLRGQIEVELTHEQLMIGAQFGVAGQDQGAPVRGREADVQHLENAS